MTSNKKFGTLAYNQSKAVDLNDDGIEDILLTLNELYNDSANISIKEYKERKNTLNSDYEELFDVVMDIKEDKIQSSRDLTVYLDFVNFGDGPSHINIIYTILNENEKEMYKGVDEKSYTQKNL